MSYKCVTDVRETNESGRKISYCKSAGNIFFLDATHAITSIQARATVQPCENCIKAMIEILDSPFISSDELIKSEWSKLGFPHAYKKADQKGWIYTGFFTEKTPNRYKKIKGHLDIVRDGKFIYIRPKKLKCLG